MNAKHLHTNHIGDSEPTQRGELRSRASASRAQSRRARRARVAPFRGVRSAALHQADDEVHLRVHVRGHGGAWRDLYGALHDWCPLGAEKVILPVGGAVVFIAFLLLAMPRYGVVQRRLNRDKKVLVDVGSDSVTVTMRPGEVISHPPMRGWGDGRRRGMAG